VNRYRFYLMTVGLAVMALSLAVGCTDKGPKSKALSYVSSDTCRELGTAAECATDSSCAWAEIACAEGEVCPDGACLRIDPCSAFSSQDACEGDGIGECNWLESDALCPPGADCASGGFCVGGGGDDCVCACPLACPEGEDCPPCECDCDGGGSGGGGTCTCACPACEPGTECPPCACDCDDDGCGGGSTCTCACPDCPPGEDCGECDCSCDGSEPGGPGDPMPTTTCSCDPCPEGEDCPECECPTPIDPCSEHSDQDTCLEEDGCDWIGFGAPCEEGEPCGACYQDGGSGGGSCSCECPACAPGEDCPPCTCGGGSPGEPVDPAPPPDSGPAGN